MLRANGMVERKQRGDGNCMFRSLSVAAGKSTEYHEELKRRVVERMGAEANTEGASTLSELGTWGTGEALKVAAEEMQVRANVITMDGSPTPNTSEIKPVWVMFQTGVNAVEACLNRFEFGAWERVALFKLV